MTCRRGPASLSRFPGGCSFEATGAGSYQSALNVDGQDRLRAKGSAAYDCGGLAYRAGTDRLDGTRRRCLEQRRTRSVRRPRTRSGTPSRPRWRPACPAEGAAGTSRSVSLRGPRRGCSFEATCVAGSRLSSARVVSRCSAARSSRFRHDCEEDAEERGGVITRAPPPPHDGARRPTPRESPPRGHEPEYERGGRERTRAVPRWGRRAAPKRPSGRRPPAPRRAKTETALAGRAGAPKCPARLAAKAERTGPGAEAPGPDRRENGGPENTAPGTPRPSRGPKGAGAPPPNFGKSGRPYQTSRGRRRGTPSPFCVWPRYLLIMVSCPLF